MQMKKKIAKSNYRCIIGWIKEEMFKEEEIGEARWSS